MRVIFFISEYDIATEMSIIVKSVYPEVCTLYATPCLGLTKERPMDNTEFCLENNKLVECFWAEINSTKEATVIVSDLVLSNYDRLMARTSVASYRSYGNKLLFGPLAYSHGFRKSLGILFVSKNTGLKNDWKSHLTGLDLGSAYSDFTTTEGMYDNPSRIGGLFKRLVDWLE